MKTETKAPEPIGLFEQIMDMQRLAWCMQSLETFEKVKPKSKMTKDLRKAVKELRKKILSK